MNNRIAVLVLVILLTAGGLAGLPAARATAADQGAWHNMGIYGESVNAIAFTNTPRLMYLVANHGTYKSTDAGQTWRKFTQGAGTGIVIAPDDGRILIASGAGMAVSADGGLTWEINSETAGHNGAIVLDPNNSQRVLSGGHIDSGAYLYRSADGGYTWTISLIDTHDCLPMAAVSPLDGDEIWLTNGLCMPPMDYSALFKSTDGGDTFTPVMTSNTSPREYAGVQAGVDGTIYVYGDGVWVKHPADSGFTKTLDTGSSLVIEPTSGDIYIDGYVSHDQGDTWASTAIPGLLGIDPLNTQRMYWRAGQGIQRSTDGGQTWQDASHGLEGVVVQDIQSDPHDARIIVISAVNGTARSTDGGATWEYPLAGAPSGPSIVFDPLTSGVVYFGTGGGTITKSQDGGDSWQLYHIIPPGPNATTYIAMDPNDHQTLYAGLNTAHPPFTQDGVYVSHDGGEHWARLGLSGLQVNMVAAADDAGETIVYAAVGHNIGGINPGGVFRYRTDTRTWVQRGPSNAIITKIAIDPQDPRHILANTVPNSDHPELYPTALLESSDSGANWSEAYLPTRGAISAIRFDPRTPNMVYACEGQTFIRSIDGGHNWHDFYTSTGIANIQAIYIPWLPPGPIESFTAQAGQASEVQLTWLNPQDESLEGVLIRYSTTAPPQFYYEGELLVDVPAQPDSQGVYLQSGVDEAETYYYAAFAHDDQGHYSMPVFQTWPAPPGAAGLVHRSQPAAAPSYLARLYAGADSGAYRREVIEFYLYLPMVRDP